MKKLLAVIAGALLSLSLAPFAQAAPDPDPQTLKVALLPDDQALVELGGVRKTVTGIKVAKIDKEHNILAVTGAVPGRRGTLLEIKA